MRYFYLRDLWTWRGRITRAEYAFWGVLLFCLKYAVDRILATFLFHRAWSIFNYVSPAYARHIFTNITADFFFYITLVIVALPFIAAGTALTVRRLRDINASAWFVLLFFLPFVNLIFFLVLCALPSQAPRIVASPQTVRRRLISIPQSKMGSALLAVLLNVVSGLVFTRFSVQTLTQYGWGLFVGVPFSIGLTSAMIYSFHQRRTIRECLSVAFASICALFLALIIFAYEGLICLIMAAPICIPLALLGAWLGYSIQFGAETNVKFCAIALLIVPLGMSGEKLLVRDAGVFSVSTSIEINAPVSEVWKNVIAFSEIPKPTEWYFRTGLAYPIRARIYGKGKGAIRHCVFSTGEFIEPIRIWNEPHHLRFSVTSNPSPMQEMTLYAKIHPPHLKNFFVSQQGEFLLTELGANRTRVQGTTWYQHHMHPEIYWRLWSDFVIHRIHLRVLHHIQNQSEGI